jgi:hypothetical protein
MEWRLTVVVGREACGHGIWIMAICSVAQSLDQSHGFVIGYIITH